MLLLSQDIIDKIITDFNKTVCELSKMRLLNKKYNNLIKPFYEHINNRYCRENLNYLIDRNTNANILWLIKKYENNLDIKQYDLLKNYEPPFINTDIIEIMIRNNELESAKQFSMLNEFDIKKHLNKSDTYLGCICNNFNKFINLTKFYCINIDNNYEHIFDCSVICGNYELFTFMLNNYPTINFGKDSKLFMFELENIIEGGNINILNVWKQKQSHVDNNILYYCDRVCDLINENNKCSCEFIDSLLSINYDIKEGINIFKNINIKTSVCNKLLLLNYNCYDIKIILYIFDNLKDKSFDLNKIDYFIECCKRFKLSTIIELYNNRLIKQILHNYVTHKHFINFLTGSLIDNRVYEWFYYTFKKEILNINNELIDELTDEQYDKLFGANYENKNIVLETFFNKKHFLVVFFRLLLFCDNIEYIKWFYELFKNNISDHDIIYSLSLIELKDKINYDVFYFVADIIIERNITLSSDAIFAIEKMLVLHNMNIFRKKLFERLGFNKELSNENLINMFMLNQYDVNIMNHINKFNIDEKIKLAHVTIKLNKFDMFLKILKYFKLTMDRKKLILYYCVIDGTDEFFLYMKIKFVNNPQQIYDTKYFEMIDYCKYNYNELLCNKLAKGNTYIANYLKKLKKNYLIQFN